MVSQAAAPLAAGLRRIIALRDDELRAVLLSFAYFFFLLSSYYILRPLRDEMGVASGVENLQWLFTGTFVAMLCAVPLFGWTVARFPKRRLVPIVYRFFVVNMLLFFVLLQFDEARIWVARGFFIWVSLFNLFVVSVFWSVMADLFSSEQGRRLFPFIAAGGTVGALLGPTLTAWLAVPLGPVNLLLIAALLLEAAVWCVGRLAAERRAERPSYLQGDTGKGDTGKGDERQGDRAIGGGVLAGVALVARSRYLLGICLYILLFTTTSTFLYFQQAHIVAAAFDDPGERTRLFALIDLAVGLLTLLLQCTLAGRIVARFGVGFALASLPFLTALGFTALAAAPTLAVLVAFQALRRAGNFAIAKPAREVLFTLVGAEQKYKSKNFIDTVVYRGGDSASGWAFAGLRGLGLELSGIALVSIPIAALWLINGLLLGREHERAAPQGRIGSRQDSRQDS